MSPKTATAKSKQRLTIRDPSKETSPHPYIPMLLYSA